MRGSPRSAEIRPTRARGHWLGAAVGIVACLAVVGGIGAAVHAVRHHYDALPRADVTLSGIRNVGGGTVQMSVSIRPTSGPFAHSWFWVTRQVGRFGSDWPKVTTMSPGCSVDPNSGVSGDPSFGLTDTIETTPIADGIPRTCVIRYTPTQWSGYPEMIQVVASQPGNPDAFNNITATVPGSTSYQEPPGLGL